jgi:hypothetical protein
MGLLLKICLTSGSKQKLTQANLTKIKPATIVYIVYKVTSQLTGYQNQRHKR